MADSAAFYQVSLIAAFIAGVVALFAPCCISYLLPAYLGNVFKEKKKIMLMTGIYSAGILAVMLPIVLGAQVLASFFFRYHTETYVIGGAVMLGVGVLTLFGIKLPMPHWQARQTGGADILSTFALGLIAGVTSACCAPVLIGVLTLSSLTLNVFQALLIGLAFVLGMVAPLYLAALAVHRGNILAWPILTRRLFFISLGGNRYPVFMTNLVSSILFFGLGILTLSLVFTGRLSMPTGPSKIVNDTAWWVTGITEKWPVINYIFLIAIVWAGYRLLRQVKKKLAP